MIVAFIGHRKIEVDKIFKEHLAKVIENLIVNENADMFLFGSRSKFDGLCHDIVTELQQKYNYINRILVRAEYEYIEDFYKEYLLMYYEATFYPEQVRGAGAKSYIKRNQAIIDMCDILVAYCDKNYTPINQTNSGTKIAVDYARKTNKQVINLCE